MTYIVAGTAIALFIYAQLAKRWATPGDVIGTKIGKQSLNHWLYQSRTRGSNPSDVEETFNS